VLVPLKNIFNYIIKYSMDQNGKTKLTTIILIAAFVQGPFLYYYTTGFFKLFAMALFGLIGLSLTIRLLINVLKYRSNNTIYNVIGLMLAFIIGITTISGDIIEYLDWNLRKAERNQIVDDVKRGILKPNSPLNNGICNLTDNYFPPISNGGNAILINENNNGIASIEFYIDRGFIDHYSAFVYTNDQQEMDHLDKGKGTFVGSAKKLSDNWYRVSY
jgi:hypothetical protein